MGAWSAGTGTGARRSLRDMLAAFDSFLTSKMPKEKSRRSDKALTHRRLGWSGRLFHEPTPNIIMSEDGLFPQTAAMLVRMSPWSFWALQKARALALQTPAIAQHPWKERVPVWWLFSFPVIMRSLRLSRDIETGYVPAVHEVSAKELITYPASTSVAVAHPQFAPGDWLVGMQGCVGIGDELCAHLARQYTGCAAFGGRRRVLRYSGGTRLSSGPKRRAERTCQHTTFKYFSFRSKLLQPPGKKYSELDAEIFFQTERRGWRNLCQGSLHGKLRAWGNRL